MVAVGGLDDGGRRLLVHFSPRLPPHVIALGARLAHGRAPGGDRTRQVRQVSVRQRRDEARARCRQRGSTGCGAATTPRSSPTTAASRHRMYFAPIGGFRFGMFSFPPGTTAGRPTSTSPRASRTIETEATGVAPVHGPDPTPACTPPTRSTSRSSWRAPSCSNSTTARRCTLHPGDTVVQNGTRHRWSNPGDNDGSSRGVHVRRRAFRRDPRRVTAKRARRAPSPSPARPRSVSAG